MFQIINDILFRQKGTKNKFVLTSFIHVLASPKWKSFAGNLIHFDRSFDQSENHSSVDTMSVRSTLEDYTHE